MMILKFRFLLLPAFLLSNISLFGQTIYSQNFGTGTDFPAGWSTNSSFDQAVNSSSSASLGYTIPALPSPISASGGSNIMFRDCDFDQNSSVNVTFNGINTIGSSNLIVYFGKRATAVFTNVAVKFEASIDNGSSFIEIDDDIRTIPIPSPIAWSTNNYTLPSSMENIANLIFRFTYTPVSNDGCSSSSPNLRIDDFHLGKNSVLPVKLANFNGQVLANANELRWDTNEEINFEKFDVLRSADAQEFYGIGSLQAKGSAGSYQFTDSNPIDGINYYRLKQIDLDANYDFSKIISLNFGSAVKLLSMRENPVEASNIEIVLRNYDIKNLRLTQSDGKLIPFDYIESNARFSIYPKENLTSGLYIFSVHDGKEQKSQRFIVK